MFTYKVDYYSQKNYSKYIEKMREGGIEIVTIPLLELHQNELDELLAKSKVDIDLTSAVKISKVNDSINYFLEKIIYLIVDKNVKFITEETYLKDLLNSYPFFIEGEKLDIGISNEVNEEIILEDTKSLIVDDANNFEELKTFLNEYLIGHLAFKVRLIKELKVYKYFNKVIRDQPIFSIFLLGSSGTGKTEIGRTLHKYLDQSSSVAKINLANYKSESSLASLIGSPPGYIGSKEESDLVRKINNSNAGVLIIDEFEKADGAIHNFFLQLLEEGKFDDALGNIHNLNGYIVVFTSNFNKNEYLEKVPPELRSRFNMVIECKPLNLKDREEYLKKIIDEYNSSLSNKLSVEDINIIIQRINYQKESNLRNLRNFARKEFYNYLNN